MRIQLKQRAKPDPMGLATRPQLKAIRRRLDHHLPSRLRARREKPPLLPPIVWQGEAPAEDGEEEEEDLEGLSVAELKQRLTKRGEKNLPRSHKKLVERLLTSLEQDDGEEDETQDFSPYLPISAHISP